MSTYRVGNHQPQNVYRESDDDPCPASVDGRCAESGEIHPPCKRGECRYDQTGARRGQYIGVMFTAEDAALVVQALNERAELLALVTALVDPDHCWFDHNGDCQAHGGDNPCPHAAAKKLLAADEAQP